MCFYVFVFVFGGGVFIFIVFFVGVEGGEEGGQEIFQSINAISQPLKFDAQALPKCSRGRTQYTKIGVTTVDAGFTCIIMRDEHDLYCHSQVRHSDS